MAKFTKFLELCAILDDKSFMYHHVMDGVEVISTTLAIKGGVTTVQTSMRAPMIQTRNLHVTPPMGLQYTPSCSASAYCVVIIDQYKPLPEILLRLWSRIQKTIVSVNRKEMKIKSRDSPECVAVLKAAIHVRFIQVALQRFTCVGLHAFIDRGNFDAVSYTTDQSGRRIFEISGVIFTEDDLAFIDAVKNNNRVRGFIKTSRGLDIQWGLPCRSGNTEADVLSVLANIFKPATDQFYCAATCS